MLFKGTAKRPTAREIAIAIERIGGIFNASTGQEESTYWAKVTQPHLDIAIDVAPAQRRAGRGHELSAFHRHQGKARPGL